MFDLMKMTDPFSVGLDTLWKDLQSASDFYQSKATTYPPYNIQKQDKNKYVIEVALAGFKPEEVEITAVKNKLKIAGKTETSDTSSYLHRGISSREFSREFYLAGGVEVESAELENGLLRVHLENKIPEEIPVKKIPISSPKLLS